MSTRKHTSTLYVCARASSLSFAHPQDLMRSRSSHGTKQHKSGDCPRTELSEDTPNYEVATFENRNLLFRSADKVQMSPTPMAHEREAPLDHLSTRPSLQAPCPYVTRACNPKPLFQISLLWSFVSNGPLPTQKEAQHSFCKMLFILSAFKAMAPRSQHRATARQNTSG